MFLLNFVFLTLNLQWGNVDIDNFYTFEKEYKDDYYIVEFNRHVCSKDISILEKNGIKVYSYVPEDAFLVKADKKKLSTLNLKYIPYYYMFRISPDSYFSRGKYLIKIFDKDVSSKALQDIENAGITIIDYSEREWIKGKWNIFVLVEGISDIEEIAKISGIEWIESYMEPEFFNDRAQWVSQTGVVNSRRVWDEGITGEGIIVSTADSGIYTDHDMFRDPDVTITTWGDYPDHRKVIAYKKGDSRAAFGDNGGAGYHGTHTAGTICGNDAYVGGDAPYDGMAKDAKMFFVDIGASGRGVVVPADLNDLYDVAYQGNSAGKPVVMSHSWGRKDGAYSSMSLQTDQFTYAHPDMTIFYAAGNSDPQVGSPGTAKNVVTVGATLNGNQANTMAGFSDPGPTDDGRVKPTVATPGVVTSSVPSGYTEYPGTSMATPGAAGSGALIYQYFKEGFYPNGAKALTSVKEEILPSAALIKAMLVNSASKLPSYDIPSSKAGWGRLTLDSVLYFVGDKRGLYVEDKNNDEGVNTSDTVEYTVKVKSDSVGLRATLAWIDYPPALTSGKNIVNDLDLIAVSPSGKTYLGNNLNHSESGEGGSPDNTNVVEHIRIEKPEAGDWKFRIIGSNVPYGPQGYALVVTAHMYYEYGYAMLNGYWIDDSTDGNGDGKLDANETFNLYFSVLDTSSITAYGVKGWVEIKTSKLTLIGDSSVYFGNILPGEEGRDFVKIKSGDLGDDEAVSVYLHLINVDNETKYTIPLREGHAGVIEVGAFTYTFDMRIFSLNYTFDTGELKVVDLNGRIYKNVFLKEGLINVNFNDMPAGIYFVKIKDAKGRWYRIKILNIK